MYLKKYPVAIIGGILAGMFACLGGVLVLSMAFGLDHTQYVTLLPKSITTAIGMGLSEELGGMVSVTVASIIVTGLFGNVAAAAIFKLFRIKHPSPSACPAAPVRTPWAPPVRVSSARLKKP